MSQNPAPLDNGVSSRSDQVKSTNNGNQLTSQPKTSTPANQAPGQAPPVPPHPPASTPSDTRNFITPEDFTTNAKVKEAVEIINQKLFTWEIVKLKQLCSRALQIYKDPLEREFCWAPEHTTAIWKRYFELVQKYYDDRVFHLRKDVIDEHLPDFEPERNFLRLIPHRPLFINVSTWARLCKYWNSYQGKKGEKIFPEEPFTNSLHSETKDEARNDLKKKKKKCGHPQRQDKFVDNCTPSRKTGVKFQSRQAGIVDKDREQLHERSDRVQLTNRPTSQPKTSTPADQAILHTPTSSPGQAPPPHLPASTPSDTPTFIIPEDLTTNAKVKEAVEMINQKVFTGETINFNSLVPQLYKGLLEHEFCWAPEHTTGIWKKYSELMMNRLLHIQKDVIDEHLPDFEPERNFLRLIPHRPGCISANIWPKLCKMWNSSKEKVKLNHGKVNKRGEDILPAEELFKCSSGNKTTDGAWNDLEKKLGHPPYWGDEFIDYCTTSKKTSKSRQVRIVEKDLERYATGESWKGGRISLPVENSHPEPEYLTTPQSKSSSIDRLHEEIAKLKRLRRKDARRVRVERDQERMRWDRMFSAAMSSIYGSLISRGFLNPFDIPPGLVASSPSAQQYQRHVSLSQPVSSSPFSYQRQQMAPPLKNPWDLVVSSADDVDDGADASTNSEEEIDDDDDIDVSNS